MNERLARHLLKRLSRKAMALALADAVEAGILCQVDVESHGRVLSVYRRHPEAAGAMSPSQAVAMLSRHRRRLPDETTHPILGSDEFAFDTDRERDATPTAESSKAIPGEFPSSALARRFDLALVKAIREAAEPPSAADVAAMLLLAQAVPDNGTALAHVLRALRLRRPIVTVLGETKGFERTFLELLKRGLILPGAVERSNGYEARYDTLRFERVTAARRRIVTFAGSDRGDEDDEGQYGIAAQSTYPILAVAENQERLSPKLVQAAQLSLACGTLNAEIVRRIIETVLGAPPSAGRLDGIDFGRLSLGDIAIAVRPGVAPDTAANSLRRIAEASESGEGPGDGPGRPSGKAKARSSDSWPTRRNADPGFGTDIIQPETPSEARAGHPAPTIETLSGYGEAKEWALQIRDELPLWRAGDLAWTDMSTKVLLSGPPGVGKTHFARALCHTLQVPLLATSVARWLEPSNLGDVLKRMKRTFAEAEAQKPCILFVDEFDGIGRRVDLSRDYADYWNSVVNCCLELLDGAARTSGVIVVCATNNPSVIDAALLRSGRIDRQIEILLPDAEARLAILRHHLGRDIETVTASVSKAVLVENDLRKVLEEGFEMMSDKPYATLVQAAIPIRTEASRP
ncbi:AAA family ATPase [Ollibium composti]|uniref:ATP-binding protein n=1 Tax=Ollibium composti TaxID=2675109 RepID=A0ABY2Q432_9HYPH|nr:ATP-binding protein [Mesorhizobium composti]THF55966.1 ATP-binding protein [Mesorhizobium composti]